MIVKKGFPNIMHVKINEITQNIEDSFGSFSDDLFHQYFTEENHCDDTPYRVNQTQHGDMVFEAQIEYEFDFKYSYQNQKASFIDAFVKCSFNLVIAYLFLLVGKLYVRNEFYDELNKVIKKVDQEVHMQSGILPQGGSQGSHSRFAYQLSFTNLYRNAVLLENFEKKLV